DTGGSIRIPAAACGVVGMKPTFGLVSGVGAFDLAHTLDHIGPLTKSVRDNAMILFISAGSDEAASHSLNVEAKDYTSLINDSIAGKNVGVVTNPYFTDVNPEVKAAFNKCVDIFKDLQTHIKEVEVPKIEEIAAAQVDTIKAEASATHADDLDNYPGKVDDEVYERLLDSKETRGYEYVQAQLKRDDFVANLNQLFDEVDVIMTPTLPTLPTDIGQREVDINGDSV